MPKWSKASVLSFYKPFTYLRTLFATDLRILPRKKCSTLLVQDCNFRIFLWTTFWSLVFSFCIYWGNHSFHAPLPSFRKNYESIFLVDQMDERSLFLMNRYHYQRTAALRMLLLPLPTVPWGFQPAIGKTLESTPTTIKEWTSISSCLHALVVFF